MKERTSQALIRAMALADLPEVLEIDRMSFPIPWPERSYRFELNDNPASHLLVAVTSDQAHPQVAGYIGFWLIVDEAHISTLAVHPLYRRTGIGADLLEAALDKAARLGGDMATLEVRVSNQPAVNLYDKFGFQIVGRRPKYYRDQDEDALLMTLTGLRSRHAGGWGGPA
jgi:ribosomal-protein-alanine N-acetyltransferase